MTEEIDAKDWKTFCERLTEMERGKMFTIEIVDIKGSRQEARPSLTLERVTFHQKDACSDAISVISDNGFTHEILEPIHVKLRRNAEGGFNPVQIDAESGTTILHFRPALKAGIVDG